MTTGRDTPMARGRVVARVLTGSWRATPPPLELTPLELAGAAPALHRSGCSGLAWRRLKDTPLQADPAARLLHDGFVYHALRVKLLEEQLADLFRVLWTQGIEAILGKGWVVGHRYPLPGLRPYGDLDLMVRPADVDAVREIVVGWNGPPPPVEVHTDFNELRDRGWSELLGRARVADLSGVPIRVFGPEDHLRLLALHALEHGLARPVWLCDIALLLETLPADFDWDGCMAGPRWEGEGVRCALGLVAELLDVDLAAADVPRVWRDPPLPRWLAPAALRAFGATEHYLRAGDPAAQLRDPRALLRSARLRWANPIEATFRRRAPWNGAPRLPIQVVDYGRRAVGVALRASRASS